MGALDYQEVVGGKPVPVAEAERNWETRHVVVGPTAVGRLLVVVYTVRRGLVRVVTAYPANRAVRKLYEERRSPA